MHRLLFALLWLLMSLPAAAQHAELPPSRAGDVEAAADYEALLTELLQQVVTEDGLVRYEVLRGEQSEDFRRVLKAVETYDPATLRTQAERLAFWMNAYNVQMLQHIIETPEVQNIEADGYFDAFFKTPLLTAGRAISLDQLEHVLLRHRDDVPSLNPLKVNVLDPRIHAGINCAAVSCPPLRRRAFTAANIDEELDAAMREFTGKPAHFRVDGDQYTFSSLLNWFGSDFDRPDQPAGDYLLSFMPKDRPNYDALASFLRGKSAEAIKNQPNVTFAYNWEVNRADAASSGS